MTVKWQSKCHYIVYIWYRGDYIVYMWYRTGAFYWNRKEYYKIFMKFSSIMLHV